MISKAKIVKIIFSFLMVLINFITTIYISTRLGFDRDLDLYYLTMSIYMYLVTVLGWSVNNVMTPIYVSENSELILSKMLATIFFLVSPVLLLLFFGERLLTELLYSGYLNFRNDYDLSYLYNLAILLFVIDLLCMIFISYENARSRFTRPIVINLIGSLVGLSSAFILVQSEGLYGAVWTQLAIKFSVLIMLVCINRNNVKLTFFDISLAKVILERIRLFILSGVYFRSDDILEKQMASSLSNGQLSLVSFVQRIFGAFITIVNTVLIIPIFTRFCENSDIDSNIKSVRSNCRYVLLIGLLGALPLHYVTTVIIPFLPQDIFGNVQKDIYVSVMLLYPTCTFLISNQIMQYFLLSVKKERSVVKADVLSFSIAIALKFYLTLSYGFIGFLFGVLFTAILKFLFKAREVKRITSSEF